MVRTPNKLNKLEKHGKSSNIKKNLTYFGVFIGVSLAKNQLNCEK